MKIVVRLPNWFGDIIMAAPFMRELESKHADSEIFYIIKPEYASLLEILKMKGKHVTYTKRIQGKNLGFFKFIKSNPVLKDADIYYTLTPSLSSAIMGFCLKARLRVGYRGQMRSLFLTDAKAYPSKRHRSEEYLYLLEQDIAKKLSFKNHDYKNLKSIILNINSEASSRRLPNFKWRELLSNWSGLKVYLIGSKADESRVDEFLNENKSLDHEFINLAGKTNLLELSNLIKSVDLVISNDSGPAHFASAIGAKVLVFFGAGDEFSTAPIGDSVCVIRQNLSCSPCLKNSCPLGTLECLNSIKLDSLMSD